MTSRRAATTLFLGLTAAASGAVAQPVRPWRSELTAMPFYREQQVEGPARDDRVHREGGLLLSANVTFAPLPWLEAGLVLGFDLGSSSRVAFGRVGADGRAAESARVETSWWELWAGPLVRARWRSLFAELAWAPLTMRHDPARVDLANTRGESHGLLWGTPTVAFLGALGAEVAATPRWSVVLRLNARIRYLTSRGGAALEGDQESGQMLVWPMAGASYRW